MFIMVEHVSRGYFCWLSRHNTLYSWSPYLLSPGVLKSTQSHKCFELLCLNYGNAKDPLDKFFKLHKSRIHRSAGASTHHMKQASSDSCYWTADCRSILCQKSFYKSVKRTPSMQGTKSIGPWTMWCSKIPSQWCHFLSLVTNRASFPWRHYAGCLWVACGLF